jgi:hypothetical protein
MTNKTKALLAMILMVLAGGCSLRGLEPRFVELPVPMIDGIPHGNGGVVGVTIARF